MDGSSTPARWNHYGEMMPRTHRQPRELTEAEYERACFWACHVPGGQRYDPVLVESMRQRHSQTASSPPPPSRPLSPESSPVSAKDEASPTPEPEEEGPEPWEADAAAGIIRKNLSLNLGWGVKTWNMKSSILHRLKMLKDDGYDIRHLQVPGTTSDQVTQAVLAHIAARQQPAAQPPLAPVAVAGPSNPQVGTSGVNQRQADVLFDTPKKRKLFATPAVTPQKRRNNSEWETRTYPEPLSPWADSSQGESEPSPKRRRTLKTAFSADRESEEVLKIVKRQTNREIFQVSRLAANARHFQTADITMEPQPSQIVFAAYNPSPTPRPTPTGYIGTRGMNAIMAEIKFLGHADVEGTVIQDPDSPEQDAPRHIQIFQDEHENIVLEGNNFDLSGLLCRLRTKDLAHLTDWEYDGVTVARKSGLTWTLSEQTQTLLANIEVVLSGGGANSGIREAVVVRIEQIFDGKDLLGDEGSWNDISGPQTSL